MAYRLLSLLLMVFISVNSLAQNDSAKKNKHANYWQDQNLVNDQYRSDIDPRQYVRVLYKKNPNYKEKENMEVQRVIWNWNDTGYFQKFKVLDNEGFINIFFKKEELAKNFDFIGNLSLEARIKGKDGERRIEVNPYSIVGEERKAIGFESLPPTTVAQNLFSTIMEFKRTIVSLNFDTYDKYVGYTGTFKEDSAIFVQVQSIVNKYNNNQLNDTVRKTDAVYQILYGRFHDDQYYYPAINSILFDPASYTNRQLKSALTNAMSSIPAYISTYISDKQGIDLKKDLSFSLDRLKLINLYISSFEKAGSDAVQAFLQLASKNSINFTYIVTSLRSQEKSLSEILTGVENTKDYKSLFRPDVINLISNIIKDLRDFSMIEGSQFDSLVNKYIDTATIINNATSVRLELEEINGRPVDTSIDKYFQRLSKDSFRFNSLSRYVKLRLLEQSKDFEKFKQDLSIEAAKIIYKKLVYASIDLGKSGAQSGDILYLYVVWKNLDNNDTTQNSSSLLDIGKYYLRQTGWRTEISESFYLVEHINEPKSDPNTSPSNFKGAYGASIMRTFYYNENFERTFAGRLINKLQPSYGFNISYLDFYTNKDIEIGAALQIGLFKNVFFFGSGINLHSIRGEEKKSAAYFMFGVSFTNIAAKFKQDTDGTSSQ